MATLRRRRDARTLDDAWKQPAAAARRGGRSAGGFLARLRPRNTPNSEIALHPSPRVYSALMMSIEEDTDLAQVVALSQGVRDLRDAVESLEAVRDAAIRRHCARPGVNRVHLARALGISRSRLYAILEPPIVTAEDGEEWLDDSAVERADSLWFEAVSRWENSGHEGTPDDYFPLDDVVAGS